MNDYNKTVVVLGASAKRERYSNQAVEMLKEYGYRVIPVNPVEDAIHGIEVAKRLADIEIEVHTLTMYVNQKVSLALAADIMKLKPERIIFNPGAENPELENICERNQIRIIKACTLVLLRTGQFEEV
jgi:predicted CoA-binding protein